ncbi:MAG TPA: hypothetical protein VJ063_07305 [Verrucomicrobiae bacterium]|nr:hypothetical protein [Verrucomicrobiae bacterium]
MESGTFHMHGRYKQKAVASVGLTLCFVGACVHGAQFLTNGGAESGSLAGWTANLSGASSGFGGIIASVTQQTQTGPTVQPIEGSRFFSFSVQASGTVANGGDHIYLYQAGTAGLTNAGLILSGRFQTTDLDAGEVRLIMRDGASNILGSVSSGILGMPDYPERNWNSFRISMVVPPAAAIWVVELHGTLKTGTAINVFYDAVALEPAEPPIVPSIQGRLYFGITLQGNVGRNYRLDYASVLAPTHWMTLTNFVLKASPTIILDPDNPTSGERFYRAVELPDVP